MNKKLIISFLAGASLILAGMAYTANAFPVTPTYGGGTGTSTIPTAGQIPVGQSNGTYGPSSYLTTSTVQNFNTILYVPYNFATAGCAGSAVTDIGDCINKLYAALPAKGGEIVTPSGVFAFTTPIVFGTANKIVKLWCPSGGGASNNATAGTVLNYTSNATSAAIIFNTNAYITGGSGITNCDIQGPGSADTNVAGVVLGGGNGAFSTVLDSVNISGFGRGYVLATSTSFNTVLNSTISFNSIDVGVGLASGIGACSATCGASGENNKFIGGAIADSDNKLGGASDLYCINNQLSGNTQLSFISTSIDDCSYYSNQFGGTANITNFTDVHWENPNGHNYPYIQTLTNVPAAEINVKGGDMMNDDTSGLTQYVLDGGDISFDGTTIDANAPVNTPTYSVVTLDNTNNNATVSWIGIKNNANGGGAASTWMVSSTAPMSTEGYATGNGVSYYVGYDATTTKGTTVWSEPFVALNTLTVGGSQSSTLIGNGTKSQIPNLDNVLFADSFPGSDIGAQINNAMASSTSITPTIYVTASSSFSTTISITTSTMKGTKNPLIICSAGVTLTYTGSGSSTVINTALGANALWGIEGCTFSGTSNTGTGLTIGGNVGANNLTISGTKWTNFNLGVSMLANVNWLMFNGNVVNFNNQNTLWVGGANSGEGIEWSQNLFADDTTINSSTLAKCVYFSGAMGDFEGFANHFDDCGEFVDTNGIQTMVQVGNYWENPNATASSGYPGYAMFTIASSTSGIYTLSGGQFKNDAQGATSTPNAPIVAGDSLNLDGVIFNRNGAAKWTNIVDDSINNANVTTKSVLNENSPYSGHFMITPSGNFADQNSSVLAALNNGGGFEAYDTNVSTPAFFENSNTGGAFMDSNVSTQGTTQNSSSSPAWRVGISQSSDNFSVQRSPATTTFNPTTFMTISNTGKVSITSVVSSTLLLGESGKPGCYETYDTVNSTTLEYIVVTSGVLGATTTKPNACQ